MSVNIGGYQTMQNVRQHAPGRAGADTVGDLDLYQKQMARFCPGRQMGALCLSSPTLAADTIGNSAWTADECRRATLASSSDGGCSSLFVAAMTITMDTSYEDIAQGVSEFGYVGLKPYHTFAKDIEDTFGACEQQQLCEHDIK